MAQREVTGGTVQELAELKHDYKQSPKYIESGVPFETAYCLTEIGKQPDDYDGPTRYCTKRVARTDDGGHAYTCRFHGAITSDQAEQDNLEKPGIAALKHGMYATDEHLQEVFTDDDQKLYDFIMSWAEAYGWPDKSEDPARYDLLEQLAIERVRAARSERYVLEEGEIQEQEVFDDQGQVHEIEDENTLTEALRLQRKLILDLMKELGLTPKEQARMGAEESQANAAEQLAEVAAEAVLGSPGDEGDEQCLDPHDPMFVNYTDG